MAGYMAQRTDNQPAALDDPEFHFLFFMVAWLPEVNCKSVNPSFGAPANPEHISVCTCTSKDHLHCHDASVKDRKAVLCPMHMQCTLTMHWSWMVEEGGGDSKDIAEGLPEEVSEEQSLRAFKLLENHTQQTFCLQRTLGKHGAFSHILQYESDVLKA